MVRMELEVRATTVDKYACLWCIGGQGVFVVLPHNDVVEVSRQTGWTKDYVERATTTDSSNGTHCSESAGA